MTLQNPLGHGFDTPAPLSFRDQLRGWWILGVGLVITTFFQFMIFNSYIEKHWTMRGYRRDVPSITDQNLAEGEYLRLSALSNLKGYVRRSLTEGILTGIGVALSIGVSIVFWKRYPTYALMNFWMTILHGGGEIAFGLYIALTCSKVFEPLKTSMPWTDFDQYLTAKSGWSFGVLVAFMILASPSIYYLNRKYSLQARGQGHV